ncbi:MAG: endonuclease domain-containing protein [Mycobacterium sp.]
MGDLVVGSEALATGRVTRQTLRTKYVKVHHNVYAPRGLTLDAVDRARAAWLWSGRKATLVGVSAAAMLGTRWLPADAPAELARVRQSAPRGIVIHSGYIADDERCMEGCIPCTTPERTAYDLGRRAIDPAILRIDALLNATRCTVAEVERIASRYPGARGIRNLRAVLPWVDGGAESPQETRLRLLLMRSGLPRLVTQIQVGNRRIDMGWPQWKVGVEYDGVQHWTDPAQHAEDIERLEFLAAQGWTIVRVSARQLRYRPGLVVERVRTALSQ